MLTPEEIFDEVFEKFNDSKEEFEEWLKNGQKEVVNTIPNDVEESIQDKVNKIFKGN